MRKRIAALVLIPATALVLMPAAAASAVETFPDTDEMYSAGYYDSGEPTYGSWAFWRVHPGDPTTVDEIAATHDDPQMITDGAYDPTTGVSYVIGYGYGPECQLWSVDVATGAYALVAPITQTEFLSDAVADQTEDCDSFDILDDGSAYVTAFQTELFSLDLADGATTYIGTLLDGDEAIESTFMTEESTTGLVYLSDWNGSIYTVNLTDATLTHVADGAPDSAYDADFDSAGTLWISVWDDEDVRLASIGDLSDIAGTTSAADPVSGWRTDAIWVVPASVDEPEEPAEPEEPHLAETGPDGTGGLIGGGAFLAVLGAALVLGRRRTA